MNNALADTVLPLFQRSNPTGHHSAAPERFIISISKSLAFALGSGADIISKSGNAR